MQDSSSLIASLQNTITLIKYKNKELTPEQEKEVITHAGLIVSIVQMDPDARTENYPDFTCRQGPIGDSVMKENIYPNRFPNLLILNFLETQLSSIEGLNRVFMPNLKTLNFRINDLFSVRNFRKCYFPNLQFFCASNYIDLFNDLNKLTEMNTEKLRRIQRRYLLPSEWIFKMNTEALQYIDKSYELQNSQKVRKDENFLNEMIKKKAKGVTITKSKE